MQPLSAIRSSWPPALSALWRRAGGSNPDPAAQPGAVLAVDECIAEDLEHITTVGLVAAASASQRRLEHPRALEWSHIAHSDPGRTPRHPHHAVVAVTEPVGRSRIFAAPVELKGSVADHAAKLEEDDAIAQAEQTISPRWA